jgi:dihydroxyacetone kinase
MSVGPTVETVLTAVGHDLLAGRDQLNELDGVAGDGDLGLTVGSIGRVLLDLAPELGTLDPAAALRTLGMAIGQQAPSTFGTLASMGLLGAARSVQGGDGATAVAAVARLVAAAGSAIATRGKAARGDKTLLDALGPAADSLASAVAAGDGLAEALAAAAAAAEQGAEATAAMEPRLGRQAWLADRARGHIDPGARAVAMMFASAARAVRPGG